MSVELERRLDVLEEKLDLILSTLSNNSTFVLNKKQFCTALGIDTKTLERMYIKYQLKIPVPYRMQGVDPKFSTSDLNYMKKFLREKKGRKS